MNKIGFACKWIDRLDQVGGIKPDDDCKKFTTGTTTIGWLSRQTREVAQERLRNLTESNLAAVLALVTRVGQLPERQRMVRLTSDITPAATHRDWVGFFQSLEMQQIMEQGFARIGEAARRLGVRVSFHPGQFTVLASENPGIVENSVAELEWHAAQARMMGFGKTFQDMKINVHISGKRGPDGIREVYTRLTPEARNCLTLENEENSWGLDTTLSLRDLVPTVLDIHHHWIREGEYIQSNDVRIEQVLESWRGVTPVVHYSVSREDCLVDHCDQTLPNHAELIESGYKKQKMRAHSDFYWNRAVNDWALSHNRWADIMCESKAKNIASTRLYEYSLGDSSAATN